MIRRGLCSQILSRNMFHFKNSLTLGGAGAKPVTSGQLLLNRGSLNEELLWIRRWGWLVGIFFHFDTEGRGHLKKHHMRDVVAYFIPALWSSLFLRDGRGITKKPFLGNFTSWFGLLTNFFVYTSLQTQLNFSCIPLHVCDWFAWNHLFEPRYFLSYAIFPQIDISRQILARHSWRTDEIIKHK